MKNKKTFGFTLIELLVVIAIIAILAAVVLVALGNARQSARNAKRQSDLNSVMSAVEMYLSGDSAPADYSGLSGAALANCAPVGGPSNGVLCRTDATELCVGRPFGSAASTLISVLPDDPQTATNEYDCVVTATRYTITTDLEGTTTNFVCTNGSCT